MSWKSRLEEMKRGILLTIIGLIICAGFAYSEFKHKDSLPLLGDAAAQELVIVHLNAQSNELLSDDVPGILLQIGERGKDRCDE